MFVNLLLDFCASLPNVSRVRLEEILRFRYYQWKGSRRGWYTDRYLDMDREKYGMFFPTENTSVNIRSAHEAVLENVPPHSMKPGDILIKVEYVGVCRTDLEVLEGTLGYYRDGLAAYPIVPGHEFSGTIVRIGSSNTHRERFKVGQRVVGECILSRRASDRMEVGVINYNGAYSQHIVMPGDAVHLVPDDLDPKKAALTEPLAVVLRALRRIRGRLTPGAAVAVFGAGTIGYLCASVLVLEGYDVTVFDKNPARLKFLNKRIRSASAFPDLKTFNVIVEATGSRDVLERVVSESGTDCTVLFLGFPYGDIRYNFEDLVGQEKVFVGSVGGDREDFVKALKILPNIEIPESAQTVLPLKEFKKAWDLHRSSAYLKVFLRP